MKATRPVVVGVDFSPSSRAAVEYGAQLAARHGAPLHLIYAHLNPVIAYTGIGMAVAYMPGEDAAVDWIDTQLKQTAEGLHGSHPRHVQIDARRVAGSPASVLIDASRHALATVVGCRGIGGFTGLLLGSVSTQVAAHGHGPVIVIRPPIEGNDLQPEQDREQLFLEPGPILVGYDGSAPSGAALEFAAAEAHARNVTLTIANVYQANPALKALSQQQFAAAADDLVARATRTCHERYPALTIESRILPDPSPEHALTEATRDAALTVVGCRGRGGVSGLLLGSVSRTLAHHAHNPVAIVHPAES